MEPKKESLELLSNELTALTAELRIRRASRGGVHVAPESGSLVSIDSGEIQTKLAKAFPEILRLTRSLLGYGENDSPQPTAFSELCRGRNSLNMGGLHAGDEEVEAALIKTAVRLLALRDDLELSCQLIRDPEEKPYQTELRFPDEWDTCVVHGLQLTDQDLVQYALSAQKMKFAVEDGFGSITFRKGTSFNREEDHRRNIRLLLDPIIRFGEGSTDNPGIFPKGLRIDFFRREDKQAILDRIRAFPSLDEINLNVLIGPMTDLIKGAILRAARSLYSAGIQITMDDSQALAKRLLSNHPQILIAAQSEFTGDAPSPVNYEYVQAMILSDLVPRAVLLANLNHIIGDDLEKRLTMLLSECVSESKDVCRVQSLAFDRFSPLFFRAFRQLPLHGITITPDFQKSMARYFEMMAQSHGQIVMYPRFLKSRLKHAIRNGVLFHEENSGESPSEPELMATLGEKIIEVYGPALEHHFDPPVSEQVHTLIQDAFRQD